ncbi:putative formaldehyde dehydrogenase [Lachnellula occidentalis]|uniref:Putative formaldehyde dehydrogenase n=1 Tax=Lachnellula occidentalis TaxID=215460 RepID=A0A8H8UJI1_9HELO|nr:putative formaldehyde dehydrogenase [Lachnellula occidentalis]
MTLYDFKVSKGSSSGDIVESTSHRPTLTRDEIYIKITHSGVCGTDQKYRHYDMVLGHEGIGVVKAIGPDVKGFKVQVFFLQLCSYLKISRGDRAGWGWVHATCGVCEQCVEGQFVYCTGDTKQYGTGDQDQGSFGEGAVWREQLLCKIPDTLASDLAAPLMCAGITVWGTLTEYNVKPTDAIGVVGIGGLGHLAVQFANKLGCEVVALSGTETKKEEALKLGAHHFVATKGVSNLRVPRKINHLLVTKSHMPDLDQYKSILAPRASIYLFGTADFESKLVLPYMQFIVSGWKLIGCTTSPKIVYQRMLEFAGLHGIKPMIERFPLTKQGVVDSLKKLDEGKMRYCGVLYAEGV